MKYIAGYIVISYILQFCLLHSSFYTNIGKPPQNLDRDTKAMVFLFSPISLPTMGSIVLLDKVVTCTEKLF